MKYDYAREMADAVLDWVSENVEAVAEIKDADGVRELYDVLFNDDAITGNASGSYTMNAYEAEVIVRDNLILAIEAMTYYGMADKLQEKIESEEWEYLDVTIRCYLLANVIEDTMEQILNQIDAVRDE